MFASDHSAFEPYQRTTLRATAAPFVPQMTSPLQLVPSAVYAGMQEPRMGTRLRIARIQHQMATFQAGIQKGMTHISQVKAALTQQVEQLRLSILRTFDTLRTVRLSIRVATLLRVYHFLLDHAYVYEGCDWFKSDLRTVLEEFHAETIGNGELEDASGLLWSALA